jgi:hypothetical protein
MASKAEDLTIEYEEDGILLTRVLESEVLSAGAWATVIFKYETWDKKSNCYSPPKYTIRRYRKINDEYRQQSKFNISSDRQAEKLVEILNNWITKE